MQFRWPHGFRALQSWHSLCTFAYTIVSPVAEVNSISAIPNGYCVAWTNQRILERSESALVASHNLYL